MKEKLMTLEVSIIGKIIHLNLRFFCLPGLNTLPEVTSSSREFILRIWALEPTNSNLPGLKKKVN